MLWLDWVIRWQLIKTACCGHGVVTNLANLGTVQQKTVSHLYALWTMLCHGWLGFKSTFALTSCGVVWAWGSTEFNPMQPLLGDGTTENRISPVLVLDGVKLPE